MSRPMNLSEEILQVLNDLALLHYQHHTNEEKAAIYEVAKQRLESIFKRGQLEAAIKELNGLLEFHSYELRPFIEGRISVLKASLEEGVKEARLGENRAYLLSSQLAGNPQDTVTLETLKTIYTNRISELNETGEK